MAFIARTYQKIHIDLMAYPYSSQITLGKSSYILLPRRIDGEKYIVIGDNSRVMKYAWISAFDKYAGQRFSPKIFIGDNVYIGGFSCITSVVGIKIDDGCVLSEFVYITDHVHGYNPENGNILSQFLESKGDVCIGKNCLIGYGSHILPGVRLGNNCVVGANSVVTRSFPDHSMIAGSPAKLIKKYSYEHHAWINIEE